MTATADPPSGDSVDPEGPDDYVGEEMTLWEHLDELRSRLFKSAVAIVVFFVVGFIFNEPLFDFPIQPYCDLPDELKAASTVFDNDNCVLIFDDVLGAFFVRLKAAGVVAVVFGGPVVFYQIWAFISPGLKAREKKYALPFVILSQLLFLAGGAFSYVVIPRGLEFLLNFGGDNIVSLMNADRYLTFLLQTALAFGASFEYPLIIAVLVLMGAVTHEGLKTYRRHAFFLAFVAAAVITPSQDPLTMVLMALPLAAFYEVCILFARIIERGRARSASAA